MMSNKLYKDIDLLGILREITDSELRKPFNRQFIKTEDRTIASDDKNRNPLV